MKGAYGKDTLGDNISGKLVEGHAFSFIFQKAS
jgi:hypothetical protein